MARGCCSASASTSSTDLRGRGGASFDRQHPVRPKPTAAWGGRALSSHQFRRLESLPIRIAALNPGGDGRGAACNSVRQRQEGRPDAFPHAPAVPSYRPRPRGLICRASTDAVSAGVSPAKLAELAEFLSGDLPHLFDDQGIDRCKYRAQMAFEDPITRYTSLDGYLFNIQVSIIASIIR